LRETQDSLRSDRLRFFFRKRLPARGFSTGKAPPPHPFLRHFPILRGNRETESEFQGKGWERDAIKPFFSWVFTWHIFLFHYGLRPCLSEFLGDCQEIAEGSPPRERTERPSPLPRRGIRTSRTSPSERFGDSEVSRCGSRKPGGNPRRGTLRAGIPGGPEKKRPGGTIHRRRGGAFDGRAFTAHAVNPMYSCRRNSTRTICSSLRPSLR